MVKKKAKKKDAKTLLAEKVTELNGEVARLTSQLNQKNAVLNSFKEGVMNLIEDDINELIEDGINEIKDDKDDDDSNVRDIAREEAEDVVNSASISA